MPNVTNATVEYGRTVKPADYESKSARVSLTFAIEEGTPEDAICPIVSRMMAAAQNEVHARLGIATAPVANVATPTSTAPAPEKTAAKPSVKIPPKTVNGDAQEGSMNTDTSAKPSGVVDIVDPTEAAAPSASQEPATAASTSVDVTEPAPSSEAKVYTDAELKHLLELTRERLGSQEPMKDLVLEFTGTPGKKARDIPLERRTEFVERLKAL